MSHNEINSALPANAWLDKEQIMRRLREEEIVEIDDFFTNAATKELMHKINQQQEWEQHIADKDNSREGLEEGNSDDSLQQQPPLLSFEIEKKQYTDLLKEREPDLLDVSEANGKTKRKRIEDMTKEELVTYLSKMPLLMSSPVCDFIVEDGKRLRGTIEKVKGDYVYIKVAFGKKWIKYTLQQIKEIKIVRF